jgi:hypothetical protein
MVGFILACTGHRYRAVAGSNPALPTISLILFFRKFRFSAIFLSEIVQNIEHKVQKNERSISRGRLKT